MRASPALLARTSRAARTARACAGIGLVAGCVGVAAGCGGTVATSSPEVQHAEHTAMAGHLLTPPEEGPVGALDCHFQTTDLPVSHVENPNAAAMAAYERGMVAMRDEHLDAARDAYAEALALDPTFSLASYSLGLVLVALQRHDEAVLAFERVTVSDPSSIDAFYNLGILHALDGDHEAALAAFQRARALAPAEIDIAKKLVQANHALGRFRDAALERREVRRIHACSTNDEVTALAAFVIDQFDVGDEHVLVFEVFAPNPEWTVYYAFQVIRGTQAVRTVQLESDPVSREQGVVALVGIEYPDDRHFTTENTFTSLPTYETLRPIAIDLIRESAGREP